MFVDIDKQRLNKTISLALDELRSLDIREFGAIENLFVKDKEQIFELDNLKQILYYFKSVKGRVFAINSEYFLVDLNLCDIYKFKTPDYSDYSEYERIQYQRFGLFDFEKMVFIDGEVEEKELPL